MWETRVPFWNCVVLLVWRNFKTRYKFIKIKQVSSLKNTIYSIFCVLLMAVRIMFLNSHFYYLKGNFCSIKYNFKMFSIYNSFFFSFSKTTLGWHLTLLLKNQQILKCRLMFTLSVVILRMCLSELKSPLNSQREMAINGICPKFHKLLLYLFSCEPH